MATLTATAGHATVYRPDHDDDHRPDQGGNDTVRTWLAARLSDAPPLTSEQLQRLRVLLAVEQALK